MNNLTPRMKQANHATCLLAEAMKDCERCPFKPVFKPVEEGLKPVVDKFEKIERKADEMKRFYFNDIKKDDSTMKYAILLICGGTAHQPFTAFSKVEAVYAFMRYKRLFPYDKVYLRAIR